MPAGFFNEPTGGAYVSCLLYEETKEEKYKEFALQSADELIQAGHNGTWSGVVSILADGGLILFLLWMYEKTHNKRYLDTANQGGQYIFLSKAVKAEHGIHWYAMDSVAFGFGKNGYFPGFFYGTAYILLKLYESTANEEYLQKAKEGLAYVVSIADIEDDAALIRYNDPYMPNLHYLGVCQGPVGTSRPFYELYSLTNDEKYKDWILKLTDGILKTGAPSIHSPGYWQTYNYCCGTVGLLEHFLSIYDLTKDKKYLLAAQEAVQTILGDSFVQNNQRTWHLAWNRHDPNGVEAWSGLYLGTAGIANSLLTYYNHETKKIQLASYLENAYS